MERLLFKRYHISRNYYRVSDILDTGFIFAPWVLKDSDKSHAHFIACQLAESRISPTLLYFCKIGIPRSFSPDERSYFKS